MNDLKNILTNFIQNIYTRHEYFSVLKGFEKGKKDEKFVQELESQWYSLNTDKAEGYEKKLIWDKISSRILFNPAKENKFSLVSRFVQKAAAILFVPLLIASVFYFIQNNKIDENSWAEIVCPSGVRTEFQLPDGSSGFLNSNSKIKFPVSFKNNRKIYLTGEAFFDVAKDRKNRFTVSTENLKVAVKGTSFNIMAYANQAYEEVTLETGKLKIFDHNDSEIAGLIPNQQFSLDKGQNQYSKKEVEPLNYTSWISGKLIIHNERFEDVVKRLNRWYDVEIVIEDPELNDYRYYATFENEPLDEVLRLIALTAPIQFEKEERVQDKDGGFTKQIIKLKLNKSRMKNFR